MRAPLRYFFARFGNLELRLDSNSRQRICFIEANIDVSLFNSQPAKAYYQLRVLQCSYDKVG